jgi:serine/threonine protein kinase
MFFHESLPIGTILDSGVRKYKIQSVLGKGGFGITYLATSTVYVDNIPLEGQFAIKEHFISSMNERQGVSVSISNVNNTDEIKESIDSFLVEAQRLNKLSLNHSLEEGYAVKNPIEAIRVAFKRMFDFTGRSSRSEFWWIFLLHALIIILLITLFDINVVISEWDIGGGHYWFEFNPVTVYPIIVVLLTMSLQILGVLANICDLHIVSFCGDICIA